MSVEDLLKFTSRNSGAKYFYSKIIRLEIGT
jgi:hypothetical protein